LKKKRYTKIISVIVNYRTGSNFLLAKIYTVASNSIVEMGSNFWFIVKRNSIETESQNKTI